jgi:predicted nucleotidyltransferase
MDLQELLGCKVDVISERGMRDRLRRRIEVDWVAL